MIKIKLSDRFKKHYKIIEKNNDYFIDGIDTSIKELAEYISANSYLDINDFRDDVEDLFEADKLNFSADDFILHLKRRYEFNRLSTEEKRLALDDDVCANLNRHLQLVNVDGVIMPKHVSRHYGTKKQRDKIEQDLIEKLTGFTLDDLFTIYSPEQLATSKKFIETTQLTRQRLYKVLYIVFYDEFFKTRQFVSKPKAKRDISQYIVNKAQKMLSETVSTRPEEIIVADIKRHQSIIKELEKELRNARCN